MRHFTQAGHTLTITREIEAGYALQKEWAAHVPPPLELETPKAERVVARILAAAPAPLTADKIRETFATRGKQLALADIIGELRAHAMFVPVDRRLWQIGRHVR